MRELLQMHQRVEDIRRKKSESEWVVATLVRATGSTYRRAGARALLHPETHAAVGLLSGGCLENELNRHAREVLLADSPKVVTFDMTSDADLVFGLGLGCNGCVQILLEPMSAALAQFDLFHYLLEAASPQGSGDGVLATVIAQGPAIAVQTLGMVAWYFAGQGASVGSSLPAPMLADIRGQIVNLPRERRVLYRRFENPDQADSWVEVFYERVPARRSLGVLGAGRDAESLVAQALALGWDVGVYDHRPARLETSRFPGLSAAQLQHLDMLRVSEQLQACHHSAWVIMTHHYPTDVELLRAVLDSRASFLGLLGPRHRGEKMISDLSQSGHILTAEDKLRLHYPVGLDLGGDSPELIALAIIAEVEAFANGRDGAPLRNRVGSIHERVCASGGAN
jgi:xanthine dehydrogenase accessory factor